MTREEVLEAFAVSRETAAHLDSFARELQRWQRIKNLVSASTLTDLWGRHIADSLQLLDAAPDRLRWLDLGSGAGLPGLVIAIAGKSRGIRVTLIEANGRKCAFLREMARQLALPVTIIEGRIEAHIAGLSGSVDVVTARALAPLSQLLDWTYPLLTTGAIGLFPKGADAAAELTDSAKSWTFQVDSIPSRTDSRGRILLVSALSRASEP